MTQRDDDPSAATKLRRIVVTHTASYVFDPAEIERVWPAILPVLGCFPRGDEDENDDALAMTAYEALGDTPLELFHPLQDDDTGYEVEDYDRDA